jgi:hypothetical protein
MPTDVFTPDEFLKKLVNNEFLKNAPIIGMVKASATAKALDFSFTTCETWVTIPTSVIKEIVFLRSVPCKEHNHPLVEITFQPFGTDEGKALFSLLNSIASSQVAMAQVPQATPAMSGTPAMASPMSGAPGMSGVPAMSITPTSREGALLGCTYTPVPQGNWPIGTCLGTTCCGSNGINYPYWRLTGSGWLCCNNCNCT